MQITCPHCGQAASPGQYCDECGGRIDKSCRHCAAPNRAGARFCAECGVPFEAAKAAPPSLDTSGAQQKQITVLFADICGSTRLIASLDAEDAGNVLGAVMQVVAQAVRQAGGVVSRQMGDGLMALFGAPAAAEDHAARACFAALAAMDAVGRMGSLALPLRAGICSGPVILRRTGRDDGDYDTAGVTAHIAARLEQAAEPGTILLAPQTVRLVTGIAHVEPVGNLALKGIAEPLEVFRLLGAADRPSWTIRSGATALSTFVGRDEELALLSRALNRAWAGRAQAVALVADAGMGKSRLLHEFLGRLRHGTWHVMHVETTAQSTSVPYFLVTALLRQLVGCSHDDSTADVAALLPSAIAALGPGAATDVAPLLVQLDGRVEAVPADAAGPARRRQRLAQSLRPILRHYADLHPLILVVEDYHWLDASSSELLHELFTGLEAARLLLLLTTRPERRPGWHRPAAHDGGRGGNTRIETELGHLTPGQADQLLEELIGGSASLAPLRAHIVARAEGTPFFLEEFARSLHESGTIAGGAPSPATIVIPASVQSILAARIDRLSAPHRRILQMGAVVGRTVPPGLLGAVADVGAAVLAQAIAALQAGGFLVESRQAADTVYRFAHALTQAVAYDTLLRSDRRTLHERVLRALEAQNPNGRDGILDQLAHHAAGAEAWAEAARYAVAAGERASRRSAAAEAKAYLDGAIHALSQQPASAATVTLGISARLRLRGVVASLGDRPGMQEFLQQCLAEADSLAEAAGDPLNLAHVSISRSAMLAHWGELPAAVELSRIALGIMHASGDSASIVSAAFTLAQALWYGGGLAEARDLLTSTAAHARDDSGQRRTTPLFVLPAAGFLCMLARTQGDLGNFTEAFAALMEAREVAATCGGTFDQVLVDANEGALLLASGRAAEAISVLERALGISQANKIEWHNPLIACILGRAYVETGRHVDARRLLEAACTFADRNRHLAKRLLCSPPLIRALAEAPGGDLAAARRLADDTLQSAAAHGFVPVMAQTHVALARVLHLGGEPGEAAVELRKAASLARQVGLHREALEAAELLERHHADGAPPECRV